MSNTTWKRSGSIHQVRRRVFCWCLVLRWPLSFGTKRRRVHQYLTAFHFSLSSHHHHHLRGCWRRPPTTRAKTDNLSIPFSSLSLATQNTGKRCSTNASAKRDVFVLSAFGPRKSGSYRHRRRRYRFHVRRQLELVLGGKVRTRVPHNE